MTAPPILADRLGYPAQELPGTVFAVVAPKLLPPKNEERANSGPTISVEKADQLQRIGLVNPTLP